MLEIDVSFLLEDYAPRYSASVAELGPDAGKITWNNALDNSDKITLTPEEIQEAKDYIRTWGAWDDEEIDAWTDVETKALIIQSAAGDYRELESGCWDDDENEINWEQYERDAGSGRFSGNLYMHEGRLYLSFCG
jgi:hypothetical protein